MRRWTSRHVCIHDSHLGVSRAYVLDRMRQPMLWSRFCTSMGMLSYCEDTRDRPVEGAPWRPTSCALTARLFIMVRQKRPWRGARHAAACRPMHVPRGKRTAATRCMGVYEVATARNRTPGDLRQCALVRTVDVREQVHLDESGVSGAVHTPCGHCPPCTARDHPSWQRPSTGRS